MPHVVPLNIGHLCVMVVRFCMVLGAVSLLSSGLVVLHGTEVLTSDDLK